MQRLWASVVLVALFSLPSYASDVVFSKQEIVAGSFFRITINNSTITEAFQIKFQDKTYRAFVSGDRTHTVLIPIPVTEKTHDAEVHVESQFEVRAMPYRVHIVAADLLPGDRVFEPENKIFETFIPTAGEKKILESLRFPETTFPFFSPHPSFKSPFIKEIKIVTAVAVQPGVVRFAGTLPGLGGVVLLDHGQELFSLYIGLSSVGAKESDVVPTGFFLGFVGIRTARFAVRLHGVWLDPREFFEVSAEKGGAR